MQWGADVSILIDDEPQGTSEVSMLTEKRFLQAMYHAKEKKARSWLLMQLMEIILKFSISLNMVP